MNNSTNQNNKQNLFAKTAMRRPSRMKYQANKVAYWSMLLFVFLNIIYVFASMENFIITGFIGVDTFFNIFILLFGFLGSVKLKNYSKRWIFIVLIMAVFQVLRIVWLPDVPANVFRNIVIILSLSATFAIIAAVITFYKVMLMEKVIEGVIDTPSMITIDQQLYLENLLIKKEEKQAKINRINAARIERGLPTLEEQNVINQNIEIQKNKEKYETLMAEGKLNKAAKYKDEDDNVEHTNYIMRLQGIDKIYPNNVQAVFNFNLNIEKGDFIVLVGPSGCGKSTTLRMIAGLEDISSGDFLIDGLYMNDKAPKDRDIAMVFQNYALYAHMTVYHNMAFSLMIRKENADIIHERVMWAANILGLTPYLNRRPQNLSGGQRQRVAVGRAMVRNPKIFLFDEPLSNLDAKLRGVMRKELKLLHSQLKTTMIYVTHDQIEALTLADRIVIMRDGYVQQVGSPTQVYTDPYNLFVAKFIGLPPMNIIDVQVSENGQITLGNHSISIKNQGLKDALLTYADSTIKLGVRPEHITIEKKTTHNKGIECKVFNNELLGAESLIHFTFNNTPMIAKTKVREDIQENDSIVISFDEENTYFFGSNIHFAEGEGRIYSQKLVDDKKIISTLVPGSPHFIGIRPEAITISTNVDSANLIGEITNITIVGANELVTVKINNTELLVNTKYIPKLSIGDKVSLTVDDKFVFKYDANRRLI